MVTFFVTGRGRKSRAYATLDGARWRWRKGRSKRRGKSVTEFLLSVSGGSGDKADGMG